MNRLAHSYIILATLLIFQTCIHHSVADLCYNHVCTNKNSLLTMCNLNVLLYNTTPLTRHYAASTTNPNADPHKTHGRQLQMRSAPSLQSHQRVFNSVGSQTKEPDHELRSAGKELAEYRKNSWQVQTKYKQKSLPQHRCRAATEDQLQPVSLQGWHSLQTRRHTPGKSSQPSNPCYSNLWHVQQT